MTTTQNDEAVGASPWDIDNNRVVNGQDMLKFAYRFGVLAASPLYLARFELNGNGVINGQDLLALAPFFGKRCS